MFHITRKNKEKYDSYIDLEDFKKLTKETNSIHIWINNSNGKPYARAVKYIKTIGSKVCADTKYVHRVVMDAQDGDLIDHIVPSETLDNRKSNLRFGDKIQNAQNRKSRNKNNKTGYRNVRFDTTVNKNPYVVQMQINGKNKQLGHFKTADEAGIFAEKMRNKYYGEFAGNN